MDKFRLSETDGRESGSGRWFLEVKERLFLARIGEPRSPRRVVGPFPGDWIVVVSWHRNGTNPVSDNGRFIRKFGEAGKRLIIMQLALSYSITVAAGYRRSCRG